MGNRDNRWWVPGALGLMAGLAVLAGWWVAGDTVERAGVAASDFLFLAEGGPQLGRLPVSSRIVLVEYDDASRREMEALPTFKDDIDLYRSLLDAGAKIVADTRMIADAGDEDSDGIRQFLTAMTELNASGRLYRDIWIAGQLPPTFRGSVGPLIANNALNMHPNANSAFATRYYPLVVVVGDHFLESLPLVVTRAALDSPQLSAAQILQQLKSTGIVNEWQRRLPEGVRLQEHFRTVGSQLGHYLLGQTLVPWHGFESKSPSVPPAGYWINYAWSPADFPHVSYTEALHNATREQFADKIVLVGYDATIDPTSDTYPIPSQKKPASAAEMAACAIDTLIEPRLMRPETVPFVAVTLLCLTPLAGFAAGLMKPLRALAAVLALVAFWVLGSIFAYRSGWLVDVILVPTGLMLAAALGAGDRYLREIRWRQRIIDLFGRYVPRAVVTQLVQQPDAEALALGGVKREVTVLFADIRGFTPFAERIPPEQVIEQLNSLLQVLVDCSFAHEGTVDKFIGDAILVLFNAPLDQPDHAQRAARAGWAMQQGIAKHPSGLTIGIGIHRGEAIVGRVGTPERMEYTAVGNTVNIASRLCSAAESGTIVVSDSVADSLSDGEFGLVAQPPLRVKGVAAELQTFLLRSRKPGKSNSTLRTDA